MQLLNLNTRISAELADLARQTGAHLVNAAVLANRQNAVLLTMSSPQLVDWLNAQDDPQELFSAHGKAGRAINDAQAAGAAVLEASGMVFKIVPVDVRSFEEKLADTGRTMEIVDGQIVIVDPPIPEPEPEIEPEAPDDNPEPTDD